MSHNRWIMRLEASVDELLPEFRVERRPGVELIAALDVWADAVWMVAEETGPIVLGSDQVVAGFELARKPVFICGVHRSGTTLLRDLLDGHPALSVLPSEGRFLTGLEPRIRTLSPSDQLRCAGTEWLKRLANPINQVPFWVLGRTTEVKSPYVEIARAIQGWGAVGTRDAALDDRFRPYLAVALAYASYQEEIGVLSAPLRWVEKTPTNEFHRRELAATFPEARFIHVVRNPMAVYASRKEIEERTFGYFRNKRRVLADMGRSYNMALATAGTRNCGRDLVVRYEQLTDDPAAAMGQIAGFIGLKMHSVLLRPTVANIPAHLNSSFGPAGKPGTIRKGDAADPTQQLSRFEVMCVRAYAGRDGGAMGYPIKPLRRIVRLAITGACAFLWIRERFRSSRSP